MAVLSLMYHDVVAGDPDSSGFLGAGPNHYKVTAARFDAHLDAIEASGLEPCLVRGALAELRLFLTFDDGGRSARETGSLLERRGWRGHFFVTTERIGTAGFLGPAELSALHEGGHLVGSHGCTHRPLTELSDSEVLREWSESKAVLEDLLGTAVTVASVPTGRYSARIGRLAAEAGYEHVFTSEPWLEPRSVESGQVTSCNSAVLVYGRFPIFANTSARRVAALCSLSRPTLWWAQGNWYARRAAKSLLGPVYDPVRRRVLERAG